MMKLDDILKIWDKIESLTEQKAKLALLGLTIQQLGREGNHLDEEELKRALEIINTKK